MNMKLSKFGATVLLTLVASPAFAQVNTDTKTATGSITIYEPLTLANPDNMVFGRVVRPATGTGTVSIAAAAGAQTVAGAGAVALDTGTTNPAKFIATGEGGATVSVSIPPTFSMGVGPGTPIVVTTSTDLATPATTSLGGSLGSASSKTFYVGGSASIPSSQLSGVYSGTFAVTVTYN